METNKYSKGMHSKKSDTQLIHWLIFPSPTTYCLLYGFTKGGSQMHYELPIQAKGVCFGGGLKVNQGFIGFWRLPKLIPVNFGNTKFEECFKINLPAPITSCLVKILMYILNTT